MPRTAKIHAAAIARRGWGRACRCSFPSPSKQGGKIGFAALGGFGVSVLDISDPANMRELGHVDLPPSVAGTEGGQHRRVAVRKTGLIYVSGYPLTEDCYEPYKDIFQIDVRDPAKPRIVGALPRPKPPTRSAAFTRFLPATRKLRTQAQRLLHVAGRPAAGPAGVRVL